MTTAVISCSLTSTLAVAGSAILLASSALACNEPELGPTVTPSASPSAARASAEAGATGAALEPWIAPIDGATCVVRGDRGLSLIEVLSFHGKPFAAVEGSFTSVAGEVERSELRLSDRGTAGTYEVHTTTGYDLIGEVKLAEVAVRPRTATLVDGWIGISRARAKEVTGGSMRLAIEPPERIRIASVPDVTMACSDLSPILQSPGSEPRQKPLEVIVPSPGARSALRVVPGGPVVGELLATTKEDGDSLQTLEIVERRGQMIKIRVAGESTWIEAWAASRGAGSSSGVVGGVLGGIFGGDATGAEKRPLYVCKDDVPLYVRDGGVTVRVGTARAGATLILPAPWGSTSGDPPLGGAAEVPLVLDTARDARFTLRMFTRGASLTRCAPWRP